METQSIREWHCPLPVDNLQSPDEMVLMGLFPTLHKYSPVRISSIPLKSLPLRHGHYPLYVGISLKEQHESCFFPMGVGSEFLHPEGPMVLELENH